MPIASVGYGELWTWEKARGSKKETEASVAYWFIITGLTVVWQACIPSVLEQLVSASSVAHKY
jgi:hypothetical protein